MSEKLPGVYLIIDQDDSKVYVGSSNDIPKRLREHERKLVGNKHDNYKLQLAFTRGHELTVMPIPTNKETDILDVEQKLLDEFFDQGVLLNLARDACAPQRGIPWTEERKEHMRQIMTGRKFEPEVIDKLKVLAKARGVSRATIEAGIASRIGKKLSPEHVEKVAEASRRQMQDPEKRARFLAYGAESREKRKLAAAERKQNLPSKLT